MRLPMSVGLALAGLIVMVVSAPPLAAQRGRLTGHWELRDRATLDSTSTPGELEQAPPPAERSGPEAGRPPRRGGGLTVAERMQIGRLVGMSQPVPAFEIRDDDSSVVITNEDGFSYTVHPGGEEIQLPFGDDLTIGVRAKWDDGALLVEFRPEGGGKMTEAYYLADSGLYLRLEVTLEHDRLPRKIWRTRMYRRVDGEVSSR